MGVKASLAGSFAWETILFLFFLVSRIRMRIRANEYLKVVSTVAFNLRMRRQDRQISKATNS
jgi:hypothetical protein